MRFAILALLLTACAGSESYYRQQTAGHVGCPPSAIEIRDADDGSWTAVCHGRAYYCAKAGASTAEQLGGSDGVSGAVTCSPAR